MMDDDAKKSLEAEIGMSIDDVCEALVALAEELGLGGDPDELCPLCESWKWADQSLCSKCLGEE